MWVGRGIHRCALTHALVETIAQQESSDASHFRPHLWREGHSASRRSARLPRDRVGSSYRSSFSAPLSRPQFHLVAVGIIVTRSAHALATVVRAPSSRPRAIELRLTFVATTARALHCSFLHRRSPICAASSRAAVRCTVSPNSSRAVNHAGTRLASAAAPAPTIIPNASNAVSIFIIIFLSPPSLPRALERFDTCLCQQSTVETIVVGARLHLDQTAAREYL